MRIENSFPNNISPALPQFIILTTRSPRFRRRSPPGGRRFGGGRYGDGRENPDPCSCLGVFGMSINTNEKDLREIFGSYGEIESVQIVYDRNTGRSRGFGFVYFASTRDATRAKEALRDTNIDGARVRIDYSVTKCGGPDRRRRSRSRSPRRSRRSGSR
uniref:RRM domain-containing protein n=1 Tax=Steinernema glaseri TaxID=37863 RepID=A0A1I7YN59_9BILA